MNKQVVIATEKPFASDVRDSMIAVMEQAGLKVGLLEGYSDSAQLVSAAADAQGLIVRSDIIGRDVIDGAPGLEVIVRAGAGYDNIDYEYAREKGVVVENTPGQNANAVAELALTMMLAVTRPLNGNGGRELKGKLLAVHGFGNIGRIVARLGKSFGMTVKVFDTCIDKSSARESGVTVVDSVQELYRNADFVSLNIPENKETTGSVGTALMELMSERGVLVNTARAGVINEKELVAVLEARSGFCYASDVAPGKAVMDRAENDFSGRVVVTPKKQGAQTWEANFNAGMAAARQVISYFKEGDTTFCVYKVIPSHLKDYTKLAVQLGRLNAAFVESPVKVSVAAYGELDEFWEPLSEYVIKGMLTETLGEEETPGEAAEYARERGLTVMRSEPDNTKGYGNAITVQIFGEDGVSHSSRGRIDEGQMEASRVGEFKARMPLDPGLYVVAMYEEGPGMADRAGHLLSDSGYNRVRLGAGPSMDHARAQAFFQVIKDGCNVDEQIVEVKGIAAKILDVPGVYDVKVIAL